jgi:hypothetical protein
MSYLPQIDVPPKLKMPRRRAVTFDVPPESGEKGNAASRPAAPKGPPRVGSLKELADWEREIGRVYRLVRRGEMTSTEGARLTYILTAGATTCRGKLQERREQEQAQQIEALRQQLEALRSHAPLALLPGPTEPAPLPEWAKEDDE